MRTWNDYKEHVREVDFRLPLTILMKLSNYRIYLSVH